MAYTRRRYGTRYARRGVRRGSRRTSTRGYVRKRANKYRRRRRTGVSRKRILNITSTKKADHMINANKDDPVTPVNPLSGLGPTIVNPANGVTQCYAWIATARDNTNTPGVPAGGVDDSSRTADVCYMRGLKERIGLESSSNLPFQWRRICFTFKGQEILRDRTSTAVGSLYQEAAPPGWMRTTTHIQGLNVTSNFVYDNLETILFRGVKNLDWFDEMNAQVDRYRVDLKYDRIRSFQSGNDVGLLRKINMWHPMNKNLEYNSDESAGGRLESVLSSNTKGSMGDYYVIDYFRFSAFATINDAIAFTPEACLYWHER
ncbi:capsid protein [Mallard associated gemycircularvirus 1]|uniref:Capsid protein n=1 Tax=Mallard associated gemycircularvirus 1 TaxID=1985386 RepID=T1YQS9_9VIRU|nr:capsid protein [Mallard associated gemycircularvirus 1]AGU67656.1 capsid protein [Mallard associated gemycircularvirus 1]